MRSNLVIKKIYCFVPFEGVASQTVSKAMDAVWLFLYSINLIKEIEQGLVFMKYEGFAE